MHVRSLVFVCLLVAACSSANEPVKLTASESRPTPPAHPPITAPVAAKPVEAGGSLSYAVPTGWLAETPSSAMRKAQFNLPKQEGDSEDAQLVLFYFGGEGGSIDDNLKRWAGQFQQPDGSDSMQALQSSTRTVNGLFVTEASVAGTLDAETMPGMGQRVRKEGWRMLAAIIETPSGPYYAKLTGPQATVARWEASFREWVGSLRYLP